MKICVVGGAGKMGKVFARIFSGHGEIYILDISPERFRVAEEISAKVCSLEDIGDMDIVIISVPIDKTSEVIREVAPRMKGGSLLSDLTSLKEFPVREMLKFSSEDVSVIGMHPLFGPLTPVRHQTVILTPGRDPHGYITLLEEILQESGARVVIMTPEEHDRLMAVVQCLSHFSLVSLGLALSKIGFRPSHELLPPVYSILFDMVGRILHQNPEMYGEIQKNPHAKEVRKALLESVRELKEATEKSEFSKLMKEASSHFGDTSSSFFRFEKLIRCKTAEIEDFKSLIGSEVVLRNLRTSELVKGRLVEFEDSLLKIELNGEVLELSLDEHELVKRS